jgi:hypothetical protein
MTFQEAHAQFSAVVGRIGTATTSAEFVAIQRDLIDLQNRLPPSEAYDVIADAIAEFSPRLTGSTTKTVLIALRRKNATLGQAAALLSQVEAIARTDSRTLTVDRPAVIAAGLIQSIAALQALQSAAKAGDTEQAMSEAEALTSLVHHLLGHIKAV